MEWLGCVDYEDALQRQRERREGVLAGMAEEVLWLLEHPAVVTLGRRGGVAIGVDVPVVRTERGGLATWHGPGQLVGYLLLDIGARRWATRAVVEGIEQGLIDWLAGVGIDAGRRSKAPGVWVAERKIGALGLHVRRGVTMHGFALNLDLGPSAFRGIEPCGFGADAVVCVNQLVPGSWEASQVAMPVGEAVWAGVVRVCA